MVYQPAATRWQSVESKTVTPPKGHYVVVEGCVTVTGPGNITWDWSPNTYNLLDVPADVAITNMEWAGPDDTALSVGGNMSCWGRFEPNAERRHKLSE